MGCSIAYEVKQLCYLLLSKPRDKCSGASSYFRSDPRGTVEMSGETGTGKSQPSVMEVPLGAVWPQNHPPMGEKARIFISQFPLAIGKGCPGKHRLPGTASLPTAGRLSNVGTCQQV